MLLSPRACLPILLLFFSLRSRSLSLARALSLFPPLFPRNLRPVLARAVAAPLNWIFPVSLTSYCTRCHSTYGCQRSRGISPPTSHLARQRQPCVRTFFFPARRIFATHESGFLSDPYPRSAFTLHASKCRPGRPVSSTTIMSRVISACIPSARPLAPLFYRRIFPYSYPLPSPPPRAISVCTSRILVSFHVSSRVFPE